MRPSPRTGPAPTESLVGIARPFARAYSGSGRPPVRTDAEITFESKSARAAPGCWCQWKHLSLPVPRASLSLSAPGRGLSQSRAVTVTAVAGPQSQLWIIMMVTGTVTIMTGVMIRTVSCRESSSPDADDDQQQASAPLTVPVGTTSPDSCDDESTTLSDGSN
jgi:hypothetical protein